MDSDTATVEQKPGVPQLLPPVVDHDHIRGPEDAPVTLVEYGDYDCPYTVRAYSIVNGLRERLGGRMRFVFRAFPLTEIHAHAQAAAEAAESAAQGLFWEMHHRLFEAHRKLESEYLASQQLGRLATVNTAGEPHGCGRTWRVAWLAGCGGRRRSLLTA